MKRLTLLGIAASICIVFSMSAWSSATRPLHVYHKLGGDFTLTNQLGQPMALSDHLGKVVLLNFGYTSCPDICPMVLARLTQLERLLEDVSGKVQVIFVSFDPGRDTVKQLKDYLGFFSPSFIGLTGSEEQLAKVAKQFGAMFVKQKTQSAAGDLFSHTDFIYLLDQQGQVRGLYNNDDTIQEIKSDVDQLLK